MLGKAQRLRGTLNSAATRHVTAWHQMNHAAQRLDKLPDTKTMLKKGAKAATHAVTKGAKALPGAVAKGAEGATRAVVKGAKALPGAVVKGAEGATRAVVKGAKALPGAVVKGAEGATRAVVKGAKALPGAVVKGAKGATRAVVKGAKAATHAVTKGAKALPGAVAKGAEGATRAVVKGAKALPGAVVKGAEGATRAVVKGAKALPGAVVKGAKGATRAVVKGAKAATHAVTKGAKALPGAVAKGAKGATRAVAKGAKGATRAVAKGAKGATRAVVKGAKALPGAVAKGAKAVAHGLAHPGQALAKGARAYGQYRLGRAAWYAKQAKGMRAILDQKKPLKTVLSKLRRPLTKPTVTTGTGKLVRGGRNIFHTGLLARVPQSVRKAAAWTLGDRLNRLPAGKANPAIKALTGPANVQAMQAGLNGDAKAAQRITGSLAKSTNIKRIGGLRLAETARRGLTKIAAPVTLAFGAWDVYDQVHNQHKSMASALGKTGSGIAVSAGASALASAGVAAVVPGAGWAVAGGIVAGVYASDVWNRSHAGDAVGKGFDNASKAFGKGDVLGGVGAAGKGLAEGGGRFVGQVGQDAKNAGGWVAGKATGLWHSVFG